MQDPFIDPPFMLYVLAGHRKHVPEDKYCPALQEVAEQLKTELINPPEHRVFAKPR